MKQAKSASALCIFLVVEAVDVFEISIEGEEELYTTVLVISYLFCQIRMAALCVPQCYLHSICWVTGCKDVSQRSPAHAFQKVS